LSPGEEQENLVEVSAQVVDETGHPAADIQVTLFSDPLVRPTTRTDAEGKFTLPVRRDSAGYAGFVASTDDGRRQGYILRRGGKRPPEERITLGKTREIVVSVVDADDKPVSDAMVAVTMSSMKVTETKSDKSGKATLLVPADIEIKYVYAVKPDAGLDYAVFKQKEEFVQPNQLDQDYAKPLLLKLLGVRALSFSVTDDENQPVAGALISPWIVELPHHGGSFTTTWTLATTDDRGTAELSTYPANARGWSNITVSKVRYFAPQPTRFDPDAISNIVAVQLVPQVRLQGTVKRPDGSPAEGAIVQMASDNYRISGTYPHARCNADGEFEVYVNPDECFLMRAHLGRLISPPELRVVRYRKESVPVELTLEPTTRIFGVLRDVNGKPNPNKHVSLVFSGGDSYSKLPEGSRLPPPPGTKKKINPSLSLGSTTDEDGRFEFYAGRGTYRAASQLDNTTRPGKSIPSVVVDGQTELELDFDAK
jgi:hypothetical protein